VNRIARAEALVGHPLPYFTLLDSDGAPYPLRQHTGVRPFALFFYIYNATPG
jgi:peroxiredoxin